MADSRLVIEIHFLIFMVLKMFANWMAIETTRLTSGKLLSMTPYRS
jgi:hypothetical protein